MGIKELMARWPDRGEFARDIGITQSHANVMALRNRIPSKYWHKLVTVARKRGIRGISLTLLAKIDEKRRAA